jgi:hypothetical protein
VKPVKETPSLGEFRIIRSWTSDNGYLRIKQRFILKSKSPKAQKKLSFPFHFCIT